MTPLIPADLPVFPEALKSARTVQPVSDLGAVPVRQGLQYDAVEQELQRCSSSYTLRHMAVWHM